MDRIKQSFGFDEPKTFWFSPSHERWLDHVYMFDREPRSRHSVKIDGVEHIYTTCRAVGHSEPFDGALSRFPDYRPIGNATLRAICLW